MTFCLVHFSRLWFLLKDEPVLQCVSSFLQFGVIHKGAKGAFLHITQVAVRDIAPELNHRTHSQLATSCTLHRVQPFKPNSPAVLPSSCPSISSHLLSSEDTVKEYVNSLMEIEVNLLFSPYQVFSSQMAIRLNKHNFPLVILCRLFPIIYYPSCTRERLLQAVTYHVLYCIHLLQKINESLETTATSFQHLTQ